MRMEAVMVVAKLSPTICHVLAPESHVPSGPEISLRIPIFVGVAGLEVGLEVRSKY